MIVLGIETSTPSGGAALLRGDELLAVQSIRSSKAHSRLLLPSVDAILRELGLVITDVDVVAVAAGPGSFTGVRVGLSIGKALCEGDGGPRLVLVPTLDALAVGAYGGEPVDMVLASLNARRGELYAAIYPVGPGGVELGGAVPHVASPAEVAASIPQGRRALLAGDGPQAAPELFAESARFLPARPDRRLCSPVQVALLGARAARLGHFTTPSQAAPVYLRDAAVSTPENRA